MLTEIDKSFIDARGKKMSIREAVSKIIGAKLAQNIIDDQGIHWAVVAAMSEAKMSDDPQAIWTIRQWNKERP